MDTAQCIMSSVNKAVCNYIKCTEIYFVDIIIFILNE